MEPPPARASIGEWLEAIKFQHTLFALPFAIAALVLASDGRPGLRETGLVLVAMVSARTCAMAWNRVADLRFDSRNPRTAGWAIPAGRIRRGAMAALALASAGLFLLASALLNRLALALAPVALGLVVGYSYTKRFTALCHFVLGLALACAPAGAWIAVREGLALPPLLLAGFVLFWVAGFDILYACQDEGFDRAEGLHSIPAALGVPRALAASALAHLAAAAFLLPFVRSAGLGTLSGIGAGGVAALLLLEHLLVRPGNLRRLGAAFFPVNGAASLLLGALVSMDAALHPAG